MVPKSSAFGGSDGDADEGVGAASPALASGSSQQVALIIYTVLLAGLKSSHHSEVRRGESVQLGKTQPLIFYIMIFHYSAIFKSKKYFFSMLFKALIYTSN